MLTYSHSIGMLSLTGRGFSNPLDAAIGPDGLLYVVNRSNFHQEGISVRVNVWTTDGAWVRQFGRYGVEDGEFIWPVAIAADPGGRIYVADEGRNDIQVFSIDGKFMQRWGSGGSGPVAIRRPAALAITRTGDVLVSEQLDNRVQAFSPNGTPLGVVVDGGRADEPLRQPWGIALDSTDRLYISDWANDRVQIWSASGTYLRSLPGDAGGQLKLRRPAGVAVDRGARVVVADWGNDRVVMFAETESTAEVIEGSATPSARAREWLDDNPEISALRRSASLSRERAFCGPTAVRTDEAGRLFVVDSCRHRIQVFAQCEAIDPEPTPAGTGRLGGSDG